MGRLSAGTLSKSTAMISISFWMPSKKRSKVKGQPTVIIAHTVKGKGVSFMENNVDFHGKAPNAEQLEKALKELA